MSVEESNNQENPSEEKEVLQGEILEPEEPTGSLPEGGEVIDGIYGRTREEMFINILAESMGEPYIPDPTESQVPPVVRQEKNSPRRRVSISPRDEYQESLRMQKILVVAMSLIVCATVAYLGNEARNLWEASHINLRAPDLEQNPSVIIFGASLLLGLLSLKSEKLKEIGFTRTMFLAAVIFGVFAWSTEATRDLPNPADPTPVSSEAPPPARLPVKITPKR